MSVRLFRSLAVGSVLALVCAGLTAGTAAAASPTPAGSPTASATPAGSTSPAATASPSATATLSPGEPAAASAAPDLPQAVRYLVTATDANGVRGGTSLAGDGYYETLAEFADFGLTIDGAYALAAVGSDNTDLGAVVDFLRTGGTDGSGRTVDDWTGIGTASASGGSIGKEAVLAETTGYDPRSFGGHDLIAALDDLVCPAATAAPDYSCAAAGAYVYGTSTFSQALGIIAQLRAGDTAGA